MPLSNNHTLDENRVSVATSSIGATPLACYVGAPVRGQLVKLSLVAQGVITTADCAVAVAINGVTNTACAFILPVAGAAAGQIVSAVPTSPVYVNEDDVIRFTPSGASGATIGGLFTATVVAG